MYFTNYNCFSISEICTISRPAWTGYSHKERTWSTITYRCYGESLFDSASARISAGKNSVCYIPYGMDFHRISTDEKLIVAHLNVYEAEEKIIEVCDRCEQAIIQPLFERLQNDWDDRQVGFEHRCAATMHEILEYVTFCDSKPRISGKIDLIRFGIDIINAKYDSPDITVADIASSCYMSEEYFRRIYKKEFGISPYQDIMEKRVKKASKLLQSSTMSVREVAAQSGFRDCKYFSALFREKTGLSPKEYRTVFRNSD